MKNLEKEKQKQKTARKNIITNSEENYDKWLSKTVEKNNDGLRALKRL